MVPTVRSGQTSESICRLSNTKKSFAAFKKYVHDTHHHPQDDFGIDIRNGACEIDSDLDEGADEADADVDEGVEEGTTIGIRTLEQELAFTDGAGNRTFAGLTTVRGIDAEHWRHVVGPVGEATM